MAFSHAVLGKLFHRRRHRTDQIPNNHVATGSKPLPRHENNRPFSRRKTGVVGNSTRLDQPASPANTGILPYGSRSLSAQVAAVKALFPDQERSPSPRQRLSSTDSSPLQPRPYCAQYCPPGGCLPQSRLASEDLRAVQSRRQLVSSSTDPAFLQATIPRPSDTAVANTSIDSRLLERRQASLRKAITPSPVQRGNAHHPVRVENTVPLHVEKKATFGVRPHTICMPVISYEDRRCSLSRKPNIRDLRSASDVGHVRNLSSSPFDIEGTQLDRARSPSSRFTRYYCDKPLPPTPLDVINDMERARAIRESTRPKSSGISPRTQSPRSPPDLPVCNVNIGTSFYERWSPSVTHETVTQHLHEIHEKQITREVHNHHFHYRTQPIVDVELKPTRHFVSDGSGYLEVAETEIPREFRPSEDWVRSRAMDTLFPKFDEHSFTEQGSEFHADTMQHHTQEAGIPYNSKQVERTHLHVPLLAPSRSDSQQIHHVLHLSN